MKHVTTLPAALLVCACLTMIQFTASAQNTFPTSGKVGVGTQSPTKDLEVVGETRLQGDVKTIGKTTVDGTLDVSGATEVGGNATFYNSVRLDGQADPTYPDNRRLVVDPGGNIKTLSIPQHYAPATPCRQSATDPNPPAFWRSDSSLLYVDCPDNTQVGILTNDPQAELDVRGMGLFYRMGIGTLNPTERLDVDGNLAVRGSISNPENHRHLKLYGHSSDTTGAAIKLYSNTSGGGKNGNLSLIANGNAGGSIDFFTYKYGDWHQTMTIDSGGVVRVGDAHVPSGYRFGVDGNIACEKILVQNSNYWPDYVFAPGYRLMPLAELEAFVTTNRHLPGIPSAKQVEQGVELAEMNRLLLEKVEELTLRLIEQNKRIEALEGGKQ